MHRITTRAADNTRSLKRAPLGRKGRRHSHASDRGNRARLALNCSLVGPLGWYTLGEPFARTWAELTAADPINHGTRIAFAVFTVKAFRRCKQHVADDHAVCSRNV